jgi:spore coat polysaccharide biosynthesis protein SpsF (cytidylyltransferase family)
MPTKDVLFMTTDYYKRNTVVSLNVDNELIIPHIISTQNKWIEKILGTKLFNVVKQEIKDASVSNRIKTLIEEYIQPTLVHYTTYEALPFFNFKVTNKAVSKKFSDNSDYSELNEINYLRGLVRDNGEYMAERLTKFLMADDGKVYPEYITGNNEEDEIRPSRKNFHFGIYIAGNGCSDCYDCKDGACG